MLILILSDGLTLPNGEDFVNKVFPNIWAFLVQLFAFIIMSLIVIKFAYKPVSNFLKKRKEFINSNLNSAQEKNSEANLKVEEANKKLSSSKKEALQIIEDAQKEAYKQKQLILEETKKEVNLKKIQADEDIAKAKEKALHESYNEVCDLALTASESILKNEVKYEDNQKLLDDFINDLEKK